RGALVQPHTDVGARDGAVLDDVVDAGRPRAPARIGPFADHPEPNVRTDMHALQGRAAGEVLEVDAHRGAVDVEVLVERARVGVAGPDPHPGAVAHHDTAHRAGIADPHAGLGRPVRGPRCREGDVSDVEVLEQRPGGQG